MDEYLENILGSLPDGLVAQLHTYLPLGAEKVVTVLVLSDSHADVQYASDSIQRAAHNDHESMIELGKGSN
jgi:hypothetical protein